MIVTKQGHKFQEKAKIDKVILYFLVPIVKLLDNTLRIPLSLRLFLEFYSATYENVEKIFALIINSNRTC